MLTTKICVNLKLQGIEMITLVQEMTNADINPKIDDVQPPSQFTANAAVQNAVQLEILRILRKIAQDRHIGRRG